MRCRSGRLLLLGCVALAFPACAEHTFFAEESHFGLKAKFNAANTTPVDVDLGFRRGVVATVPMQDADDDAAKLKVTKAAENGQPAVDLTLNHDSEELTSLFTKFDANIGFDDPIEVRHFLATGLPAIYIVSSEANMRKVNQIFDSYGKNTPPTPPTSAPSNSGGGQ